MSLVGTRQWLMPNYSPKVDADLATRLRDVKDIDRKLSDYLSLWERVRNWFVGVNSQQFTVPLWALQKVDNNDFSTMTLQQCRYAMNYFNVLLRRKNSKGYNGPKIVEKILSEGGPRTDEIRSFSLVYKSESEEDVTYELCKINVSNSEKLCRKTRDKFEKKVNGKGGQNVSNGAVDAHLLVRKSGKSFVNESKSYQFINTLLYSHDETQLDNALLSMRRNTLDPRLRFKIQITSHGCPIVKYSKSYWVIYPDNSISCIRKIKTSINMVDEYLLDEEDKIWKKLPEENQAIEEKEKEHRGYRLWSENHFLNT